MTSTNRNTAIAEPRPKSLTPPKLCRHICTAITAASDWDEPGAIEMMMSKTLRTLISIVMNTTESTGASIGTVTRRNTCHSLAPSVRAASSTSREIAASPAPITTIAKPAQTQMYAMITDGVISCEPSHGMPANGAANVEAAIPGLKLPPPTPSNVNDPSSPVVALCTVLPDESISFT